jgi:glycogen operon protein
VREFKMMVRALHAAGLEVILDVVYNHTAEGNTSVRRSRFAASTTPRITALQPNLPRYYEDFTGCGNTLNMRAPACCS